MNLTTQKINDIIPDERTVEEISGKLGLNRKLVELLIMRGYDNVDAINVFLHPSIDNLYPPETMLSISLRTEYALCSVIRKPLRG